MIEQAINEQKFYDKGSPFLYIWSSIAPAKIFYDKDRTPYLIYIKDCHPKQYYTIVVHTLGKYSPNTDKYGNEGYYTGGHLIGFLWLTKSDGDIYRAEDTMCDSFWVEEDKRRKGIGSYMHDYANEIIGIKTTISEHPTKDSKIFWEDRLKLI